LTYDLNYIIIYIHTYLGRSKFFSESANKILFLYDSNISNKVRDTLPQIRNFLPLRLTFIYGLVKFVSTDVQGLKIEYPQIYYYVATIKQFIIHI